MRTEFSAANTESDVEQFFLAPFMTDDRFLGIPDSAIRSKPSLETIEIDKGRTRKRYIPDYIVFSDGFPLLVIEAKRPDEHLDDGYAEAQLYAFELNKRHSGEKPVQWVCATNGKEFFLGRWDQAKPQHRFGIDRLITLILEGLSGKNARKSLEMFGSVLTSAHFDTREFTSSALTGGTHHIQEATLLKALMRTNYLFFKPGHGFVRNIYDFPGGSLNPSHFLKFEILKFLVDNRKKMGDTRYEGYFTTEYICGLMTSKGFLSQDAELAINSLLADELIMSEELTLGEVSRDTAVRVRSSGYVHFKILAQRTEYISACALVTPMADADVVGQVGMLWQISDPQTDINARRKRDAAFHFLEYLKRKAGEHRGGGAGIAEGERVGTLLTYFGSEALHFSTDGHRPAESSVVQEQEFDRLFAE